MDELTRREEEILKLILKLKDNQEISDWLNISISTVKTHKNKIFQKAGYRNTLDLLKKRTA